MLNSLQKRIKAEKNGSKDRKVLYKLIIEVFNTKVFKKLLKCKTMENLRNRIKVKLVSNKKDYLK